MMAGMKWYFSTNKLIPKDLKSQHSHGVQSDI